MPTTPYTAYKCLDRVDRIPTLHDVNTAVDKKAFFSCFFFLFFDDCFFLEMCKNENGTVIKIRSGLDRRE